MPAMRKVLNVTIGDWITEGEWHEDMQYHDTQYFIIAECADGKYVHEFYFLNNPEGAERFAQRVEDRGYIDLVYWGFHEFFSLSLEDERAGFQTMATWSFGCKELHYQIS